MKFYTEVTAGVSYPLHTYYLSDNRSKMVGYIRVGTKKLVKFSAPGHFDPRGRRFTVSDRWGKMVAEPDSAYMKSDASGITPQTTRTVRGSTGTVYTLTRSGSRWTCTCPGYGYRGRCKHSQEIESGS